MAVYTFEKALEQAGNPPKRHLLLGNGFSIALRPKIFTYGSLLENADFSKAPEVAKLFASLGTQDFEVVIKHLMDTVRVLEIYRPDLTKTIAKLKTDAEVVKDALVTAVAKRHPDRPYNIEAERYAACRAFLWQFEHIFTLNYDVLLYWTMMQDEVDRIDLSPDDGFRHPEQDPNLPYVSWQEGHRATVHYLHGGLHLFDAGTEMIKYTWSKTDVPIVDQIRAALDENKYPIFVAEGTSQSKMDKILHNAYLHKSLRSFESCCDAIRPCMVIFGHSLAPNDDHILRTIARGKIGSLLVSLYGDPDTFTNKTIIANANKLVTYRETITQRHPLQVIFYDAQSAKIWG